MLNPERAIRIDESAWDLNFGEQIQMKKNLLAMVAVALLAGPMAAKAIPMRFEQTTNTSTVVGSWFADFNDTGDGLFSLDELTAFSGVTSALPAGICFRHDDWCGNIRRFQYLVVVRQLAYSVELVAPFLRRSGN